MRSWDEEMKDNHVYTTSLVSGHQVMLIRDTLDDTIKGWSSTLHQKYYICTLGFTSCTYKTDITWSS